MRETSPLSDPKNIIQCSWRLLVLLQLPQQNLSPVGWFTHKAKPLLRWKLIKHLFPQVRRIPFPIKRKNLKNWPMEMPLHSKSRIREVNIRFCENLCWENPRCLVKVSNQFQALLACITRSHHSIKPWLEIKAVELNWKIRARRATKHQKASNFLQMVEFYPTSTSLILEASLPKKLQELLQLETLTQPRGPTSGIIHRMLEVWDPILSKVPQSGTIRCSLSIAWQAYNLSAPSVGRTFTKVTTNSHRISNL